MKKIEKYIIFSMLLIFVAFSLPEGDAQKLSRSVTKVLRYNKDGRFKIAQFTDIHWKDKEAAECEKTTALIQEILKVEQPDLIVLTGDIVNDPADEGWKTLMSVFTASGIPFAVTMGNHDFESNWTRNEIFDYLETLPGFLGEKGPEEISGVGNYVLELKSLNSDENSTLFYFFDSNAYSSDRSVSDYDWIKFDQIAWYRDQSAYYTSENGGNPLPALAFFHIPLPEYAEIKEQVSTIGERSERVCSPLVNTGLLMSFIEMKDVMGTFVGHDHNNNYSGMYKGIGLNYGQSSGYSGYGNIGKGARIIELQEGKYGFNTWVRFMDETTLHYNFPMGGSFREKDYPFAPAVTVKNLREGLNYRYYKGEYRSVHEMLSDSLGKKGFTKAVTLKIPGLKEVFGLELNGFVKIPSNGIYKFFTSSDDGSQLYIDNQLVVDNDGPHGIQKVGGLIALEEGFHDFKVLYFNKGSKKNLVVSFMRLGREEREIPDTFFFRK